MSQEAVDLVREGWRVFDEKGLDAWLAGYVAEDAQIIQAEPLTMIDAQSLWHGWDGWHEFMDAWLEQFDDYEVVPHEVIDAGGGDALVTWSDRGRGKLSGAVVERSSGAFIHTVSQGKIVRTVQYATADEAFEAAGLPPRQP